jgi:SP family facilitated glucose transporter-like MFS transporter 1
MILVLSIFAAVLGMFQFGYNTAVINQPKSYIEKFIKDSYAERDIYFTDSEITPLFSLVVAATLVGGMIGGLAAGYVADRWGRKTGLLYVQGSN